MNVVSPLSMSQNTLLHKVGAFSSFTKHSSSTVAMTFAVGDTTEDSQIFFLLHDFTGRRFILTVGLSDLSIPLPVKLKVFTFSLKALYGLSLAYLNCQHRDSWPLGSLLSKIRVT